MFKNKKILIGISIFITIAIATSVIVYYVIGPNGKLADHDNIVIWDDSDFKNYKFEGEGTKENPYLIQNLNISTTSREGIYVTHTTKHFIIQNSYIDADRTGIYLDHIAEGSAKITNNTVANNTDYGIYIVNSDNIEIIQNICTNNGYGILIRDSFYSTIRDNTSNYNRQSGIYVISSLYSIVENNLCLSNRYSGISLEYSYHSVIINNTCVDSEGYRKTWIEYSVENGGYGIYLLGSAFSEIVNNTLADNFESNILIESSWGTSIISNNLTNGELAFVGKIADYHILLKILEQYTLDYYLSFIVENNFVNNKSLGFHTNLVNESISDLDEGQTFFINCSNLQINNFAAYDQVIALYYCDNAQISNSRFSYSNRGGLVLYHSENSQISGNLFNQNVVDGLTLYKSSNSLVINNTANRNGDDGINNIYNSDSIYENNTCKFNSDVGIASMGSTNVSIISNVCGNNLDGITTKLDYYINIKNNTLYNNAWGGIFFINSDYLMVENNNFTDNHIGISLRVSSYNNFSFNLFLRNDYGIQYIFKPLEGLSSFNIIHNNTFIENLQHAIYMQGGDNNSVHHNSFIDNKLGGTSQGYDSGNNNTWFDIFLLEGNFWSDYGGVGSYSIEGEANSVDLYPL
ncbi:MAG: right-handed parallel beta-helix repeat-containing protein [Candidatus Heimdallarchaeota archaeon]|nr:right-handed parallel beta-helix repeat-containing protein [Candidatus Heimdallarchaeota archaeon]MCK5142425.1 right-handed parallel beta-helix repeat-containing protein [Candidatus Heimdallarchaeota archaeon]